MWHRVIGVPGGRRGRAARSAACDGHPPPRRPPLARRPALVQLLPHHAAARCTMMTLKHLGGRFAKNRPWVGCGGAAMIPALPAGCPFPPLQVRVGSLSDPDEVPGLVS